MTFFHKDEQLETLGSSIINSALSEFTGLSGDRTAITWIVYDPPVRVNTGGALSAEEFWKYQPRGFSNRGSERIYPASIVKLFYLVAIWEWAQKGMIKTSPELERAVRDMIVDSSNDATSLVVDALTGTTSGQNYHQAPLKLGNSSETSSTVTFNP